MLLRKVLYFSFMFIGLIFALLSSYFWGYQVRALGWVVWGWNFILSPLILLSAFYFRIFDKELTVSIPIRLTKALLGLGSGIILTIFTHLIIGGLMSFFLQMQPLEHWGPNGFINHFSTSILFGLLTNYWPLLPVMLCLKSSTLLVSRAHRKQGHSLVREAALALIIGTITVVLGAGLPSLTPFQLSSIFWTLIFIPWPILIDKDILAKARDKEADLAPNPNGITQFTDRGSLSWGIAIMLFGLIFVFAGVGFGNLFTRHSPQGAAEIAIICLFIIVFIGFGLFAMFFGINLGFAYRHIELRNKVVSCTQKYFQPFPKKSIWNETLDHYKLLMHKENHESSDGPDYTSYEVKLKHESNEERSVVLYRAYHPEGINEQAQAWAQALNIELQPS